jgi:hypothetical protein
VADDTFDLADFDDLPCEPLNDAQISRRIKKLMRREAHAQQREREEDFAHDGNPLHAWDALATAYRHDLQLPKWVMRYLFLSWGEIMQICDEAADGKTTLKQAERVGKALAPKVPAGVAGSSARLC